MKLKEFTFSKDLRKDTSFVDFVNEVTTIINQGLAAVVIKVNLADQTAAIGATTIYTPNIAGEFRVSLYAICTTAGTGTLSFELGWTDEIGVKTIIPIADVNLNSTANGSTGSAFLHAVAGAITFETTIAGLAGSPTYDLFITLEQLA